MFKTKIILSKRKRSNKNKVIAVWSPTATGKTMVAVNLSVLMSEKVPTALVDLAPDNAAHTWLNCQGEYLNELINGNPESYFQPINAPKLLRVYTAEPGTRNLYNGEASVLNSISKALDGFHIVYDTPRDYLKAANILTLADKIVIVADYNIHGTLLTQKYLRQFKNIALIVNKDPGLDAANPEEILKITADMFIPDEPAKVQESILTGAPLITDEKFKSAFQTLLEVIEIEG